MPWRSLYQACGTLEMIRPSDHTRLTPLAALRVLAGAVAIIGPAGLWRYARYQRARSRNGTYAVVASMGGAPKHPVWYLNAKANPDVDLQDGETVYEMRAREVTGDEKMAWWSRAVDTWPSYDEYQARTRRVIPVLVLEPRN